MRSVAIAAALAGLAACSAEKAAVEPETEATATTEAAAANADSAGQVMAADGKSPVGKFRITRSDGTVFTEDVRADGTFTSTSADGKVETGRWVQKTPGTYCTTMDEPNAKEECHTETVDEKGVWSSTDPEGKTGTVVRIEG